MSRIVNVIFAMVLLVALLIALDPNARRRAAETVRNWEPTLRQLDDRVVVNVPPVGVDVTAFPSSTPRPTATAVVDNDSDEQIPVTGDEDSSDEPIIQINWDALGDSLREFWESLKNVKIDFTPKDNQ